MDLFKTPFACCLVSKITISLFTEAFHYSVSNGIIQLLAICNIMFGKVVTLDTRL